MNVNRTINNLGTKNHYALYSAIFRLFICVHLLKSLFFTWSYLNLLYRGNSFLPPSPTFLLEIFSINSSILREHIQVFLSFYVLVILFYFFGIGKYLTAILLCLCYELIQRMCHLVLNGGDNLMKFILIYMIFVDSYQYFSISKIKFKSSTKRYLGNYFSNVGCFSICLHLCLAYFISGWHKIHADVWFNGVATYYVFSLERFKGTPFNDSLVKNGFFVTATTYFTMIVEIYYPILIWFRKTKKVVSLCAILLHTGIYIFMMIYGFQLVFIMVQGFFFSNKQWVKLLNKYKHKFKMLLNAK